MNNNLGNMQNINVSKTTDFNAASNKKCILSIIGVGKVTNICLNDFKKRVVTFGRAPDNDIVIPSNLVSAHHGYLNINNDFVSILDNDSKNGIYVNGVKCTNGYVLDDGDYFKIDNPDKPLSTGVLVVVSIGENISNKWVEFDLIGKQFFTIGRSTDCDIVLDRISVSLKHARIVFENNNYFISPFDSRYGVILNDSIIHKSVMLKNKDVILINDFKLIFNDGKLLYQKHDPGVRLDAIDIVKTVHIKGKKRDISQHVNFTATSGKFIAFVGGSGTGKSTFMKCISGVTKPTSGKVLINGKDLFNNYSVLKNLIGYVPQDNIIFDDLTLKDVLKYAANLRMPDDASQKEKNARIKEVLEIVELSDRKDTMIRSLSGGQQKRACIAVELLADPKVLFMDEPTSGLDPGTERSIMKTLRKMADNGKTVILVTHNTLNLHLCDKVLFFGYGGKLCFDGTPREALEFFNVNDFVDIYNIISSNVDGWHKKFNDSEYKKIPNIETVEGVVDNTTKRKSFFKQFLTLTRRKFKTLFNNKQQLLLLFSQAPIISLLLVTVVNDDLFYSYSDTKTFLFGICLASIWIGIMNSILEVCKERVILQKEYMADLRLDAYLSSKVLFLFIIAIIQSILLILPLTLFVDVPRIGLSINWIIEMFIIQFFTIFAASILGLLTSVIAKNASSASSLPVVLAIPQLLFAGVVYPLEGTVEKISNFMISRWSIEALGTINDLNSLVDSIQEAIPGYVREIENYYTFTLEHLTNDLVILLIMIVIYLGLSYFLLKRQLEVGKGGK